MEELDKFDKKIRNISLIVIFIAIILLVFWVITIINYKERSSPILMSVGIAMLLAGILLFTRIQYIIWMKKRY